VKAAPHASASCGVQCSPSPCCSVHNKAATDRRVIFRLHAIVDVALGQSARRRQHSLEIAQTVDDDTERRHQLAALLRHIAAEQRLDRRRNFEQAPIEYGGGLVGYRCNQLETVLNGFDLIGRH